MAVLIDTGLLYANADGDDEHHEAAAAILEVHPGPLLVPMLVVAEVTYLIGSRLGADAEVRFLGDLAQGNFIAEGVAAADWTRIATLVARYSHLPLGTTDASIIAAAERLRVTAVATFDRRHFAVVHPSHTDTFELLP